MTTRFKYPRLTGIFLVTATIFCLYSVSLGHNFLFDDEDIILLNPIIRDTGAVAKFFQTSFFQKTPGIEFTWDQYFRPFTLYTFALDYRFWGVNPLGYNLTNILLHCLTSTLLFLLLSRIFKNNFIAFLCALLYAAHTAHTEAVTYIASRGDLLAGVFTLSALLFYWNGWIKRALLAYALSLFSKESCLLIPLYLIFLDAAFLKTRLRELFLKMTPFFLTGFLYVLYRKTICPVPLGPPSFNAHESVLRFFSMGPAFLDYLQALVMPASFKFCERVDLCTHFLEFRVYETIFIFSLLLIAWLLTLRYRGAAFFGLSLFFASLMPSSQIISYTPQWAEHYLYVPAMGLVVLLGCWMRHIFESKRKIFLILFVSIYAAFLLFISAKTLERNSYYKDSKHYYEALTEADSPYAYYGYINLGIKAVLNGSWDKAFAPFRMALALEPSSETNNFNVGLYYFNKGKYEEAAGYFQKAYETPMGRHQPNELLFMGQALMRLGKYEEAMKAFEKAQKSMEDNAAIYRCQIRTSLLAGRPQEALRWVDKGLEKASNKETRLILLTEKVITAYLYEMNEVFDASLDALEKLSGREGSWYGEIVRLFHGKISVEAYEKTVEDHYPLNKQDSRYYILMSYVIQRRSDLLESYLKQNKKRMVEESADKLFTQKIIERAENFLAKKS